MAVSSLAAAPRIPAIHVVIEAAGPDMPRADTASSVEISGGRVMTVYQKYEAGALSGKDAGFCRIWSKTSSDGGRTWGHPRMLVDVAEGDVNVANAMLLKLNSGDLILVCHRYHPPKPGTSTAVLLRSQDDGETFVEEATIWKRPPSYRVAIPPLNQMKSGRILMAMCGRRNQFLESRFPENFAASTVYSDDGGRTWNESGGMVRVPKRGAMEPSVAQRTDGTLVMSIRTQLGGPYIARSTDHGQTWTTAKFSGLEGGESGTCLRRIPGTDDLVLFFNNSKFVPVGHHHYGERTPLSAALSRDGGHKWQIIGNLADDPQAEYTNLDCLFTSRGETILTYMFAKPAWNRRHIDLRAAIFDTKCLCGRADR
jgi:sialidase-1